jgi:serine/threonine-protein kinase
MLVGEPPHTGPTVQAVIAAVITKEPEWIVARRSTVPSNVAAAVHQALAKLPADRFDSAQDFARALADPGYAASGRTVALSGPAAARPTTRQRWTTGAMLAAALAAGLGGGWLVHPSRHEAAAPLTRFYLTSDTARPITNAFALAPDGRRVVYVARLGGATALYDQRFSELAPSAIPATAGAEGPVFFSPDGQWIAFSQSNALRRVRSDGSQLSTITPLPDGAVHGAWGPDGTIVLSTMDGGLMRVSSEGGQLVHIALRDSTEVMSMADVTYLPDGRTLLCGDWNDQGRANITAVSIPSGEVKVLGPGSSPRFVPPDRIVYGRSDGSLYTQRLDLSRLELTGTARRLAEGVSTALGLYSYYDVAPGGRLAYLEDRAGTASLSLVDRQGKTRRLLGGDRFWVPRVSPDGRMVAYGGYTTGVLADIWLYDLRVGSTQRLTSDTLDYNDPVWSPDGKRLAVSALNGRWKDISVIPIDAPQAPKRILERYGEQYPTDWSPDGKYVIFTEYAGDGGGAIGMVPAEGGEVTMLAKSTHNQAAGRISPDGRWLAFDSDETGQTEIYVQPFPGPGRKTRLSSSGGRTPQWSRSGGEIFYYAGDSLMAVQVRTTAGLEVAGRRTVMTLGTHVLSPLASFDALPDGQSFVVAIDREPGNRLAVVSDIRTDTAATTSAR